MKDFNLGDKILDLVDKYWSYWWVIPVIIIAATVYLVVS